MDFKGIFLTLETFIFKFHDGFLGAYLDVPFEVRIKG